MADGYTQNRGFQVESHCGFERTLRGEYCTENAEVKLDGLRLCERHASRLRLEERATYWRAVLAHIRLWSGEARNRERDDILRLLEIEQLRASAALERVLEDLEESRDWDGEGGSGDSRALPPVAPATTPPEHHRKRLIS
jgi:hypothetical protein